MAQLSHRGIPEHIYERIDTVQAHMLWHLWWKSFQSWDNFMVTVSSETGESTRAKVGAAQTEFICQMYNLLRPLLWQPITQYYDAIHTELLTTLYECCWLMYARSNLGYSQMAAAHQVVRKFGNLSNNRIHIGQNIQFIEAELRHQYLERTAADADTETADIKNNWVHAQRIFVLGTIFFVALTQQAVPEKLESLSIDLFQSVTSTLHHEQFIELDTARQLHDIQIQQALWRPTERLYNSRILLFPSLDKQWRIDAGIVQDRALVDTSMDTTKSGVDEIASLMLTTQVKLMKMSASRELKKKNRPGIQAIISENGLGTVELLSTKIVTDSQSTDTPKLVTIPIGSPLRSRSMSSIVDSPTSSSSHRDRTKSSVSPRTPRHHKSTSETMERTLDDTDGQADQKKNSIWTMASPRKSMIMPSLPPVPTKLESEPSKGAIVIAKRQQLVATILDNPLSLYAYSSAFVGMVSMHLVKSNKTIHTAGMWTFLAQTVGNPTNSSFDPAAPVWAIHKTMHSILRTVLPSVLLTDVDIVGLLATLAETLTVRSLYMERIMNPSARLISQWFLHNSNNMTTQQQQQYTVNPCLWVDTVESKELCETVAYLDLFIVEFSRKEREWLKYEEEKETEALNPLSASRKFRACIAECKDVRTETIHKLYTLLQHTITTRKSDDDTTVATMTTSSGGSDSEPY